MDKTRLIEELLTSIEQDNRWLCFTRPRRFGKSVMASMVAAYFGDACDSHEIFDQLEISKSAKYQQHLNQHHVIHIDFSRTPLDCNRYQQYIMAIRDGIQEDIACYFPETRLKQNESPWDALEKTGQTFIFVLDEWDAVFHMSFMNEQDKNEHMLFLKNLLKDRAYVELAYMTGVLPIAKYSSGSELNMFMEYSMIGSQRFSGYFGFSDQEVDQLYEIYRKNTEKAAFGSHAKSNIGGRCGHYGGNHGPGPQHGKPDPAIQQRSGAGGGREFSLPCGTRQISCEARRKGWQRVRGFYLLSL